MKVVIDSSVWLEYLTHGQRLKKIEQFFKPPNKIIIPVIVIYEIYKKIKSERGESEAVFVIAQMERLAVKIFEIDQPTAIKAADISVHYKIPMADSLIYTSALLEDAVVVTTDMHFNELPSARCIV